MLYLPYPPTVNTYWRSTPRGVLVSAKGRDYRERVVGGLRHCGLRYTSPVAVDVTYFPPDRRKRDLDNLPKALFDALQHAGVLADDSLIVESASRWGEVDRGHGAAIVVIWETDAVRRRLEDHIPPGARFGRVGR